MVSASFKTKSDFFADRLGIIPRNVTFDNFKRVWTEAHFDKYFINTVIVTAVTVLLVLIMTAMAGYVLGRYSFFGKNLILLIFVASITIPLVSTVIPTYQVVKNMHLVGTRTGLILAGAGGAHVVFLMLFSGYFKQIPKEMEEAAKIDGCGFFQLFLSVMLPLAKPIATTVVIMETVWTWNAFLLPLVLTLSNPSSRTLAVGLYAFKGENTIDWTGIAAGGTVSVIPIILLFLLTQKYFVDGIAGAVKS
jgi:raffinose/stachyose/melibiose transport system permease protein